MNTKEEEMQRLQHSIDNIDKRLKIDSNDLDYETHLRQKKQLQQILDRMKQRQKKYHSIFRQDWYYR